MVGGGAAAMDVMHERCAGVDISKADVKVCVRVPGPGRRRRKQVRTFSTMTNDLLAMRDWLLAERVTVVGMEATGAYWKPVFYLLEHDLDCWLLNARHMFEDAARDLGGCLGRSLPVESRK